MLYVLFYSTGSSGVETSSQSGSLRNNCVIQRFNKDYIFHDQSVWSLHLRLHHSQEREREREKELLQL